MIDQKEIELLIRLLDDPDEEVFLHVEEKLLSFGETGIQYLERAWENTFNALLQERIENLIHKIQFKGILNALELWHNSGSFDLLQGLLIVNRYQYPDIDEQKIINQIEIIKREIWMQMMYSMNAMEKVRLMNNVFYNTFGFTGNIKNYHNPQNSYLSLVLESKKGNPILLACLYSILAQKLDIPVYGVNLPKHFILAYTDYDTKTNKTTVLFYINAFNRGQVFGRQEVLAFLKQLQLAPDPRFFTPCTNSEIIVRVIRNLIISYGQVGATEKIEELKQMLNLLS